MKELTREEIIEDLVISGLFCKEETGTPSMEFYIKYYDYEDYLIEEAIKFYNLFGYDIGMKNVIVIDRYIVDNEDKIGYWEILDINTEDIKFMMMICQLADVDVSFDKWIDKYNKLIEK